MLKKFNKAKRLKTHGFLERMSTKGGCKVLGKRREKGRHQIVVGVHSK